MGLIRMSLIILVVTAAPGALLAQDVGPAPHTSKVQNIRRLLELTGGQLMGEQILDQMVTIQRRTLPQVPEAVWKELRLAFDTGEMVEMVIPIWDKHFTEEDILGLIAFYESPVGAKLRQVQPQILQESMAAGEAWGLRIFERLKDRLRQKGYSAIASKESARSRRTGG